MLPIRPVSLAVSGVLTMAALTGCASSALQPVTDYAGEPRGVAAPASSAGGAAYAVWMKNGDQIGIALYGSSTCPPKVESLSVASKTKLAVRLAPIPGGVCARDYVPHTTVFAAPPSLSTTSDITLAMPGSSLTLPIGRH